MKVHQYIVSISALLANFFFLSCEKLENNNTMNGGNGNGQGLYKISGHLYDGCDKQPVANKTFEVYQNCQYGGELGKTSTDANGYFSMSYTPKNTAVIRMGIPQTVGYAEYAVINPYKSYENISLFKNNTCYLKVSMQVYNNTYTNQDTLFIGDAGSNGGNPKLLKIPGPFTSRLLYEMPNYGLPSYVYGGVDIDRIFRINNTEFNQGNLKLIACDTVNYVAEIR